MIKSDDAIYDTEQECKMATQERKIARWCMFSPIAKFEKGERCRMRYLLLISIVVFFVPSCLVGQASSLLWPAIEPYKQGMLKVSDIHTLYYECSGNPHGVPVVVLHGGPGGGSAPGGRRYCNPAIFNIVQYDQRGTGKSLPYAELRDNTTQDLVADIERLRIELGIDSMYLFGGSWGSTLALAYAEEYPGRVRGFVLRGVFLATDEEIDYFYHGGLARLFPDLYEELLSQLPDPDRRPLPAYLSELLQRDDSLAVLKIARAWTWYEVAASFVDRDSTRIQRLRKWLDGNNPLSFALFENAYMARRCFLEPDQLMRNIARIAHLPAWIVNGRFDAVCPSAAAWRLHRAMPASTITITLASGHSAGEAENEKALVGAFSQIELRETSAAGGTQR